MKKLLLIVSVLMLFQSVGMRGQSSFWTEDFGTGTCINQGQLASAYSSVNGAWTVTVAGAEGADPNPWYVSTTEAGMGVGNCGDGCLNTAALTNQTLHIGASMAALGDAGAVYDAGGLCGILTCPQTNRRAESPIINCTGISSILLSFNYITAGNHPFDQCTVEYSTNGGTTWSALLIPAATVTCAGGHGIWTAHPAITLPAACNNCAALKIGFHWVNNDDGTGTDPSFAVDDIRLNQLLNSITTGAVTGSPFCACNAMSVPFTSFGTFISGNNYTAQLSDAAGSFASPVTIGSVMSTLSSGTIACTIPCGTLTGTHYRVRVVSSSPGSIGSNNGTDIIINTAVTPSVTASPSANPICAGTSVSFFAGPINGGTTPTYQWQVNGVDVIGATSLTYTTSTLTNGDVVTVVMVSSAACASPTTVTSPPITMVVTSIPASVTISAVPSGMIPCGTPVTFTATPTNGGTTPTYQWQINGINVTGATSVTYTSSTLITGSNVTVLMTTSSSCALPAISTSNSLVMTVSSITTPTITATGTLVPCVDSTVILTASAIAGGTYLWSTTQTTQSITVNTSGVYSVTETTASGLCSSTSAPFTVGTNAIVVPICLVTVDSASAHNIVVWEKTLVGAEVDSFRIYREVMTSVYSHIASVSNDSLSVFHDYGANPNVTSYKYKIATLDTCGNVNPVSDYHNTIHLQYLGGGNLQWTLYDIETLGNPVTYYIVERDDLGTGNFLPISSTIPGTNYTYTDINYATYPLARYRVNVTWSISCNPTHSPLVTTRSNVIVWNPSAVAEIDLSSAVGIYPNPTTGEFKVVSTKCKVESVKVFNVLGECIFEKNYQGTAISITIPSNTSSPSGRSGGAGIYFVQIVTDKGIVNRKLVKE